jgi:hypothetical protein
MIPAAYGYGLFVAYYAALFCLALVAHTVWAMRTARAVWRQPWPKPARLFVIAAAVLTPVIGFYAALVMMYARRKPALRIAPGPWSLIMPTLAAGTALLSSLRQNWRYTETDQSWENVIRFFPGYLAFYGVTFAVIYMAARVFGFSHRGPLATRVHLVAMAVLLLFML